MVEGARDTKDVEGWGQREREMGEKGKRRAEFRSGKGDEKSGGEEEWAREREGKRERERERESERVGGRESED